MFLSVFDVFKIGIGPSSSHTMGPMTAAGRFLDRMRAHRAKAEFAALRVGLYGSLAFTGKGHATDRAVAIGLLGHLPSALDIDKAERDLANLKTTATLQPKGLPPLAFDPTSSIVFEFGPALPGHANGMQFAAIDRGGAVILSEIYYSIGGGFVVTSDELNAPIAADAVSRPYPFDSAAAML